MWAGRTTFIVGSTVQGSEPGWEDQDGYSAVGKIGTSLITKLGNYASVGLSTLMRKRGVTVMRVETTTLDFELGEQVIDS